MLGSLLKASNRACSYSTHAHSFTVLVSKKSEGVVTGIHSNDSLGDIMHIHKRRLKSPQLAKTLL